MQQTTEMSQNNEVSKQKQKQKEAQRNGVDYGWAALNRSNRAMRCFPALRAPSPARRCVDSMLAESQPDVRWRVQMALNGKGRRDMAPL
ncbi:hypothetical protein CFE70_007604 [Pyrenophora teres f. teres 0-1]